MSKSKITLKTPNYGTIPHRLYDQMNGRENPVAVTVVMDKAVADFLEKLSCGHNSFFDEPSETITTLLRAAAGDLDADFVKDIAEADRAELGLSISYPEEKSRRVRFDEDLPF